MVFKSSKPDKTGKGKLTKEEMDRVVARVRKTEDDWMKGYREQSLRIHPWVCASCGREFTNKNLHLLTVHHKDHNHNNNPLDGSNWENLCIYCHDHEHSKYLDYEAGGGGADAENKGGSAIHKPFAGLADLLKPDKG